METINLETTRDEAFLREVEAESGQKVTVWKLHGGVPLRS